MALDPVTAKLIAKVVISQITDEEKRQRLIICLSVVEERNAHAETTAHIEVVLYL